MFVALKYFEDLQDDRHAYNAGDVYPRAGLEVSEERIAELLGTNNLRGEQIIAKVNVPETADEATCSEMETVEETADEVADAKDATPTPKKSTARKKKSAEK